MTTPETVGHRRASVPVYRRITASLAVLAARLLATQPPHRIRTVLRWVQRRARPATYEQAKAARDDVVAVSMICGAREGMRPAVAGHRPVVPLVPRHNANMMRRLSAGAALQCARLGAG